MKPIGIFYTSGIVPKSLFLNKLNETMSFSEVLFKALCLNTVVNFFCSA